MNIFLIWIIGWFILSLGYYISFYNDKTITKKLLAYCAFWNGIFSWIGIIFWVILFIVGVILEADDWIEEKLNII